MDLNGVPITREELAALGLVGFGHFTSMRVEAGIAVRGLSLHLDRLVHDCREVFATDLDPDLIRHRVLTAVNGLDLPVVARVTIFDPNLPLNHPGAAAQPHILVTTRPAATTEPAPLTLQSAVYSRDLPRVKHIGLFGALHHRAAAQRAGFDDVVFTEADGTLTEIATSNIGFIAGDTLIWPDAEVLPGTTMQLLSQVRDEIVRTGRITLAQLTQFDGAVATNAAAGARAVTRIDEHRWPARHPLVDVLRKDYELIPPQRI